MSEKNFEADSGIDPFQKALKQKKQREEDQQSNDFMDYSEQEIKYLGFEDNVNKAFRILGYPWDVRQSGTDSKLILKSDVLKDTKKSYSKIVWPWKIIRGKPQPDPDWIFTRLVNKVRDGKWEKYTEDDLTKEGFKKDADGNVIDENSKKGKFRHYHEDLPSFKRLSKEGNTKPGDTFHKEVWPRPVILLPVLDRLDDWCAENKHAKILTNKLYIGDDEVERNYDPGISVSAYDKMWNHIMDFRGNWDIDIIVKKYPTGQQQQRDYLIKDATDGKKIPPEIADLITDGPLTEEEKNYTLYNLDEIFLFKETSAHKLKKDHINLFKMVDLDFANMGEPTNFTEELEELVRQEKAEFEKAKKTESKESPKEEAKKETKKPDPDWDEESEEVEEPEEVKEEKEVEEKEVEEPEEPEEVKEEKEEVAETPPRSRKRKSSEEPSEKLPIDQMCVKVFPHWDSLPEVQQKNFIAAVDHFEGTIPIWKNPKDPFECSDSTCCYPQTDVQTMFPSNVVICPVCGKEDLDEE